MVQRKYLEMFLEEGAEILSKLNQRILRMEGDSEDSEALQSALRLAHTLKGGAKMVGLENVSRAAHAIESLLKENGSGRPLPAADATAVLGVLDQVREVLALVAEGREGDALDVQLSLVRGGSAPRGEASPEARQPPAEALPGAAAKRLGSDRLRVSVGRLDALQNLVDDLSFRKVSMLNRLNRFQRAFRGLERIAGADAADLGPKELELVRRAARLLVGRHFGSFVEDVHQFDRITSELQSQVLELRMVPLVEVLDEHYRSVRDLAQELGKEIALTIDGKFTEVDKRLLEAVQAPLMHLLRNAVDHGIEFPEERLRAGKSAQGQVVVRAYHKASAVVIEVEDDGRGLDPSAIRERARAEGFLTPEQAAGLSDDEAYYLLCEPGFTTRERVTEVSGRGVGLDVVRFRLESVKGSLSIQSEPGRFTRFRMFLPLSISTLSTLVVRAGEAVCAIPSLFVERCFKMTRAELTERGGTVAHGNRVLPAVSLARVVGEPDEPGTSRSVYLALLQFRGRQMALQVDALEDEREVVLKGLGDHLAGVPFILGVSFLADEQPVPVLNVVDLHSHWPRLETTCRYSVAPAQRRRCVLVVDDSMTTRHMEGTILEGLGYDVVQAADGAEAWDRLQKGKIDLVLTDVEMPNLDGLDLTRRVRASERFSRVPVVVVSNRSRDEDLEAGFLAGADAYLRKDRFSQRELAATLQGFFGAAAPQRTRRSGAGKGRYGGDT